MIHRCWFMRKIVNYINWNVFEERVEALTKKHFIKSTSSSLASQEIPSPGLDPQHTGCCITGQQLGAWASCVPLSDRNEPREGWILWGANSQRSESLGRLVKCRFPGPASRDLDSLYLEWSPEIWGFWKTCLWGILLKSFPHCQNPVRSCQSGLIWSIQWFLLIPEGAFNPHILRSHKRKN